MAKMMARQKILVVEDAEDHRSVLRWLLEMDGYEIVEAGDGLCAVDAARRESPDLILMDISLPKVDGLQAMREIRASAALRSVPIIAMSAYDQQEIREQALLAGCTDYAPKPLDLEQLEVMIRRYLSPLECEVTGTD
ncbi:MAG TPA: response regulator [Blastocatellia bacterium]|nr:response regulator [Blastocatellia bacterium]